MWRNGYTASTFIVHCGRLWQHSLIAGSGGVKQILGATWRFAFREIHWVTLPSTFNIWDPEVSAAVLRTWPNLPFLYSQKEARRHFRVPSIWRGLEAHKYILNGHLLPSVYLFLLFAALISLRCLLFPFSLLVGFLQDFRYILFLLLGRWMFYEELSS